MSYLFPTLLAVGLLVCGYLGWKRRTGVAVVPALILVLALIASLLSGDRVPNEDAPVEKSSAASPPTPPAPGPVKAVAPNAKISLAKLQDLRPEEVTTHGYVGSDACIECHAENHATWDASYHSKMTQVADPAKVIGDFDNVTVINQGRKYIFTKDVTACWVDMPDEHDPSKRISAPIVLTTGSHHMQVYWFATGNQRTLGMLPLVYLVDSKEWVPRESAFLVPPNHGPSFEMGRWNEVCSSCHSTHKKERRLASGQWDTHVGEFGISCEACHGPGEDHIAMHRGVPADSPADSASLATRKETIVNPIDLPKVAAAQVCGQCHSVSDVLNLDMDYEENGHGYRPGDDLSETHAVWRRESPEHRLTMEALDYPDLDTLLNETYYPDGMIRVSGREYNGLIESSCYIKGEMTCLSCHKMHKGISDTRPLSQWANDQLNSNALDNHACTQCHDAAQYSTQHTHHAAESTGSNCYNCHMPHTAYGLLKAIRNHQISSPDVEADHRNQRPNACNLCHLDQTLQWSADHLQQWYDIDPPELDADEKEIAASLIWLLKGNAALRAISAWHMGWEPAQQTSGDRWQLPFLSALLDDNYEAIRLIARRSIRSLPGGSDFTLDVVTSSTSEQREKQGFELVQRWMNDESSKQIDRPELLIHGAAGIQVNQIRALIDQRDNTRVLLSE